jgi:hypothetical protein
VGGPTIVLDHPSPVVHGGDFTHRPRQFWISNPSLGKHMCFDGRFLHAAPAGLQEEDEAEDDDDDEDDDNEEEEDDSGRPVRVTFLVNVWLNYMPSTADPLPAAIVGSLQTPVDSEVCRFRPDMEAGVVPKASLAPAVPAAVTAAAVTAAAVTAAAVTPAAVAAAVQEGKGEGGGGTGVQVVDKKWDFESDGRRGKVHLYLHLAPGDAGAVTRAAGKAGGGELGGDGGTSTVGEEPATLLLRRFFTPATPASAAQAVDGGAKPEGNEGEEKEGMSADAIASADANAGASGDVEGRTCLFSADVKPFRPPIFDALLVDLGDQHGDSSRDDRSGDRSGGGALINTIRVDAGPPGEVDEDGSEDGEEDGEENGEEKDEGSEEGNGGGEPAQKKPRGGELIR